MAKRPATQHDGEPNPRDITGLCLLSPDGGGVRGLSTLYILKGLMDRLNIQRREAGLPSVKPCEVFDLIGGTGTSGLIAIIFGRLEMDVDECITAYADLTKTVFSEKLNRLSKNLEGDIKPQFDSATFERAIKGVIARHGISETAGLNDSVERGCRTFVCTTSHETKRVRLLRSYTLPDEPNTPTTTCEAALTTSAATSFFDVAQIGAFRFIDGAPGANNPVNEVENEASNIWCSETADLQRQVRCFVSVGTGHPGEKAIEDKMIGFLSKALVELATETERTAERFVSQHSFDKDCYFRFDVQQGLQGMGLAEYKEQDLIEAATEEYLTQQEQSSRMRECVSNLEQKQDRTETTSFFTLQEYEALHKSTLPKAGWNVPFERNTRFVGRGPQFNQLQRILFAKNQSPKIAIFGLGGMGKTQIALELAFNTREKYPDCSILWMSATNAKDLAQAFIDVGKQLKIPGIEKEQAITKELVERHLSRNRAGRWLLVVDDLDDMNIWKSGLKDHLPKSQQGCVVCTTRNRKIAADVAASNIVEVPEMEEEIAMQLLSKSLSNKELFLYDQGARELLRQLSFVPLVILQAASYINKNGIALSTYLSLLEGQEQDMIDILSRDFEDGGRYKNIKNPIAATWLVSFKQIQKLDPLAVDYLSFVSCLASKDIPQSLLPPALSLVKHENAIRILEAYSFVTRRVVDESFDVHRLVQLTTRGWLRAEHQWHDWAYKALKRLLEMVPPGYHDKRKIWTTYLPQAIHVTGLMELRTVGEWVVLMDRIGRCERMLGRYKAAEYTHKQVLWRKWETLGENNPSTLISMSEIGLALSDQGKYREAEKMHQKTLALSEKILSKNHPDTLNSMNNLAGALSGQGKYAEAEKINREILALRKRMLSENHPSTLTSMNNLAVALSRQGKYTEAEKMCRDTLALRK